VTQTAVTQPGEATWGDRTPDLRQRIRTSLENFVFALGELAGADRASLFVVDEARSELRLEMAQTEGPPLELRMPVHCGVAGLAWERDEPIRVHDAYACPRFHAAVDARTGYRTRSILCVPVHGRGGRVAAVLELLNPIGRLGFSPDDEREVRAYEGELQALLGASGLLA
jgi:adenylate cyclase